MAGFSALYQFENETYELVRSHSSIWQQTDFRGRPASKSTFHPLVLEIRVTDIFPDKLVAYAIDSYKTADSKIVYKRSDTDATLKYLLLKNAYCIGFHCSFDARGTTGESSLRVFILLSTQDITFGNGNGEEWVAPPIRGAIAAKATTAANAVRAAAPKRKSVSKDLGFEPGSDEHKAAQRQYYLEEKKAEGKQPAEYAVWEKKYYTVINNNKRGYKDEREYRKVFGGTSKILKTKYTNRQIDLFREDEAYCGQLKTGPICLREREQKDLQKDEDLIDNGYEVEYILEKGASKPMLEALKKIGAKVTIGRQI
jgi:hypothetical protein